MPMAFERDGQLVKYCNGCEKIKPVAEYSVDRHKKDGYRTMCRECTRGRCNGTLIPIEKPDVYRVCEQDGRQIKRCQKCEKVKEATDFYVDSRARDGRNPICGECMRSHHNARNARLRANRPPREPRRYEPVKREEMLIKRCPRCEEVKPVKEFRASKSRKTGTVKIEGRCKKCANEVAVEKRRHWSPERLAHHRKKNLEQYYKHRDKSSVREKERRKKPEVKAYYNAKKRERRANDLAFRLKGNVSGFIRVAITENVKAGRSIELLGCTVDEFKAHIEAQFTEGMSWDLWGTRADGISLDHILPCALFDMSDARQQRICFNYRNVRPMWHRENIAKQDNLEDGRCATDLTPNERQEYLTSKGYGYLFSEPPEAPPNANKAPRPWRFKPVIRDDGKWYESIKAAEADMGMKRCSLGHALKTGRPTHGHLFRYATPEDKPSD